MTSGTGNQSYFSVDILFGEAFDFNLEEVADAVSSDYPEAAVDVHPVNAGKNVRTDKTVLGMFKPVDPKNGHVVLVNGTGQPDEEFRTADHSEIAWRSGGFAHFALDAIKSHKSYITLSVQTPDNSLKGQFRAVRQLMAVSAVFAELPISLGVLVHWSSHMLDPGTWVEGAQKAMRGDWPISEWVSFRCGWNAGSPAREKVSVGHTKGLRNFLGFEAHIASAPIPPSDAKMLLRKACLKILESGKEPINGDFLRFANDPLEYRIQRPQNSDGSFGPVMVLLHPEAPELKQDKFAPTVRNAISERMSSSQRPNPDFMKTLFAKHSANPEREKKQSQSAAQPPCVRPPLKRRSCSVSDPPRAAS